MGLSDILMKIGGDTSQYEKSMRDIKLTTKKTTAAVVTMWAGAASSIYGAYKIWDQAKIGAKMEQERQAFDNLAASYGRTGQSIVDELRKASAETVDLATLVNKAGTAMMMGINPADLASLMQITRATSRQTGQSVVEAFSDISLAVGRQSRMILDNLGIIVRVEDANEKYAKSLGKTTSQLTDADKKQAFLNATISAGQDLMKRMGNENVTAAEKAQQVEARIKDIADKIKTLLIPNLESWATWLKNIDDYWSKVLGISGNKEVSVIDTFNQQIAEQTEAVEKAGKRLAYLRDQQSKTWIKKDYYAAEIANQTLELKKLEKQLERTVKAKDSYTVKDLNRRIDTDLNDFFGKSNEPQDTSTPKNYRMIDYAWDIERQMEEAYNAMREEDRKAAQIKLEIAQDVTEKINSLTMDELEYKKWCLGEEVRALKLKAGDDKELLKQIEQYHTLALDKITKKTEKTFGEDLKDATMGWASEFSSALNDALWESENTFDDIAKAFGKMITQMMIQKEVVEPFMEDSGKWFKQIGQWVGSYFSSAAASAKGNVFAGAGINVYENRIVDSPVIFPFKRGIGLMGEGSKAEAILPLTRTSSGDLGVEASMGGGFGNIQYIDMRGAGFWDREQLNQTMDAIAARRVEMSTIQVIKDDYEADRWTRQNLGRR